MGNGELWMLEWGKYSGEKVMASYNEIKNMVFDLPPEEQLRLIHDVLSDVRHRVMAKPQRNITELRGLGKEIWQGIDAQEYVNQERGKCNG